MVSQQHGDMWLLLTRSHSIDKINKLCGPGTTLYFLSDDKSRGVWNSGVVWEGFFHEAKVREAKKKTIFIWLLVQFIIGSQNGFTYSYFASSSSLVNHQPLTGGMCCALWKYSNLSLCLNYNLIFIRTSLLLGTAPLRRWRAPKVWRRYREDYRTR